MKTSIDYGFMLVFLACLFACCACEEAKDEKFLLRGGASSTIEKSLPDSVLTIDNTLSLNQDNEKIDKAMTIHDVTNKNLGNNGNNEKRTLGWVCVKRNIYGKCIKWGMYCRRKLGEQIITTRNLEDCECEGDCGPPPPTAPSPTPPTPPTPTPPTPTPPSGPGGHDDPHLQTWKGRGYGYHDQCDLIYTTCPKFDDNKGLHLHLRTEFVLPRKWSTISSIALQIGDNVLEVQNNGTYFLDGERYDADLILDDETILFSGHKLSHATTVQPHVTSSIFTVELVDDVSLEIMTRQIIEGRNSISFKISGVHQHRMNGGNSFSDCGGLSSTWDHPEYGELLIGRSGKSYRPEDAADFGPEWQVDLTKGDPMLFYENIGQHLPDQKCLDSPLHAKDQRHLKELYAAEGGALARQAKEACSHLSGGSNLFDACFFDVLVTGDVTFAQEPWYNGE